jgi:hypothetical protein
MKQDHEKQLSKLKEAMKRTEAGAVVLEGIQGSVFLELWFMKSPSILFLYDDIED